MPGLIIICFCPFVEWCSFKHELFCGYFWEYSVNITGNISAGEVTTMVEVLRNTSILVKNISAPGLVYKNVNIWVGSEHVYYEAVTDSFSPFAVTAKRSAQQPVIVIKTPAMPDETPAPEKTTIKQTSELNGGLLVGVVVLITMVAILAVFYLREKKKI